jgi:hypothetical protein
MAIYFMHYDFHPHSPDVACTPAMAAGTPRTLWELADMVNAGGLGGAIRAGDRLIRNRDV